MRSVLIVDDDLDLLEMMEIVLRRSEMQVECLSHGMGLFDTLSNFRPDIVIMDIYLGDSDGRNLCQQLKTSADYKDIPIILYSAGIITKESIEQSLADEFIVKPFNVQQLIARITTLTAN
ncbi:MAG: response regulator [Chitinophagaceae bacterium]|nr:response regulator [Chitinophagaceae bacterium]